MKTNAIYITMFALGLAWVMYTGLVIDKERMSINYCFDSNGEHYIAPNENCNH